MTTAADDACTDVAESSHLETAMSADPKSPEPIKDMPGGVGAEEDGRGACSFPVVLK